MVATQTIYTFGTSGYRDRTDEGFNAQVVTQITDAIADYLISEMQASGQVKPVLLGGDTRDKTAMALPVIAQRLVDKGLDVYQTTAEVPTPMLAFAAAYFDDVVPGAGSSAGAILLTASHNPWDYGGYNFLTPDGAVVPGHISKQFQALQAEPKHLKLDRVGSLKSFDAYAAYAKHLKETLMLDYAAIKASGLSIGYDPLFATGSRTFPRFLDDEGIAIQSINVGPERPVGYTGMPEPDAEQLEILSKQVQADSASLKVGFSNDGDADRFGVLDEQGQYLHPNTVLALVVYHQAKHRGKNQGAIIRSQATSHQLDELATHFGLSVVQTPVGYKYIAESFEEVEQEQPVVLGGESSGGLSIGGHVPEKDGLLANLLIAELIAKEGKPLSTIVQQVNSLTMAQYRFRELTIYTDAKQVIIEHFSQLAQQGGELLPGLSIDTETTEAKASQLQQHFGTRDGIKLYLNNGGWVLVRASGTEPLIRLYSEMVADSSEAAEQARTDLEASFTQQLVDQFGVEAKNILRKA